MTTQPSDEDTLIQAARAERGQHRSGASMFALLGVAAAFGAAGCLLIFLPHLVSMLLPWPVRFLGGFSMPVFVTLGILAIGIAGFFLLAALASSPVAAPGMRRGASSPCATHLGATTRRPASPARAADDDPAWREAQMMQGVPAVRQA